MEQSSHPEYPGSKTEEKMFGEKAGADWVASAVQKKLGPARGQGPQFAGQATLPKYSFDCERRMFHVGESSLIYMAAGLCVALERMKEHPGNAFRRNF